MVTGWMDGARCRDGQPSYLDWDAETTTMAHREYCGGCPVADDCLEMAMATPREFDAGIWAGTDRAERHRARMRARRLAKAN